MKAQFAAAREHAGELFGRVADFAGIQPDADNLVAIGQRLLQRFKRLFFAQMAQETHDQQGADTEFGLRIDAGAVQSVDNRFHADPARRVRLRIEKKLGMRHVVCSSAGEISHRHVMEILLGDQHAGAGVVDVQKALQIGEGISAAQFLHAGIGKRHAVALGQRKDQFWLQRAFDVDVQFGLGHLPEQRGQAVGGNGFDKLHGDSKKEKGCPKAANKYLCFTAAPSGRGKTGISRLEPCRPRP